MARRPTKFPAADRQRVIEAARTGDWKSEAALCRAVEVEPSTHRAWLRLGEEVSAPDGVPPRTWAQAREYVTAFRLAWDEGAELRRERWYRLAAEAAETGLLETRVTYRRAGPNWQEKTKVETRRPDTAILRELLATEDRNHVSGRFEVSPRRLTHDEMMAIRRAASPEQLKRMVEDSPPGDGDAALQEVMAALGMRT